MFFTNEYEHTIDDKGRLSLPSQHRAEIGDIVVLGRGSAGQLHVWPMTVYRAMLDTAEAAVAEGDDDTTLKLLLSYVQADIDRQGRIIIPAMLRRHAKLDADVTIVGQGNHIEIWNRDSWQKLWDDWVEDRQAAAAAQRAREASQAAEKPRPPLFKML